jgi:hypothetical protein
MIIATNIKNCCKVILQRCYLQLFLTKVTLLLLESIATNMTLLVERTRRRQKTGRVRVGVRDSTGCAGLGRRTAALGAVRPEVLGRTKRGCCVAALNATY